MAKYLFDLIDWGADKELEKCYRFFLPFQYCTDTLVDAIGEEYSEESLIHKLPHKFLDQPIGHPFKRFWVEYHVPDGFKYGGYCVFSERNIGGVYDINLLQIYHFIQERASARVLVCDRHTNVWADKRMMIEETENLAIDMSDLPDCLLVIVDGMKAASGRYSSILSNNKLLILEFLCAKKRNVICRTPNRQKVRKAQREVGIAPHSYYELEIDLSGEHYTNQSGGKKTLGLNRYHSVRGYIRTKNGHAEIVRAHMRGSKKRGTIDKDYVVAPT